MAYYEMEETTLVTSKGEQTVRYPRMRLAGRLEMKELVREAVQSTTFNPAEAEAALGIVFRKLGQRMAMGYSVHVEGLGTFTPSLRLKEGRLRETGARGEQRRNAQSIEVGGIHFKPDKEMLREVNSQCRLERSERKFQRSSTRYTEAERLELARNFLQTHSEMALWQYCALTGLLKNKASRELRRWEADPATGICGTGHGISKRWKLKSPPLP